MKKVMNSELAQRVSVMITRLCGIETLPLQLEALNVGSNVAPFGTDFELVAMPYYLNTRATTIYAGSNEVQRDLIGRALLAEQR
jgi:alkylation response protein AidB-like acyl-CoA dehydrogenase